MDVLGTVHARKELAHTCFDSVRRTFRAFSWTDMFRVVKSLELTGRVSLWTLVLSKYAGPGVDVLGDGFAATLDVLEMLFSQKYCSVPLSRHEIEHGQHLNAGDIKRCLDIAFDLSGLPRREKEDEDLEKREAAKDDFDVDDCVFMAMRYGNMNWVQVHDITWQELLWHYEKSMGYQLKYEMPLHGIDTAKAVVRFEQAIKARDNKEKGLPVAGSTHLSEAKFLDTWDEWEKEQERTREVAEGTKERLENLKALMGDKE